MHQPPPHERGLAWNARARTTCLPLLGKHHQRKASCRDSMNCGHESRIRRDWPSTLWGIAQTLSWSVEWPNYNWTVPDNTMDTAVLRSVSRRRKVTPSAYLGSFFIA